MEDYDHTCLRQRRDFTSSYEHSWSWLIAKLWGVDLGPRRLNSMGRRTWLTPALGAICIKHYPLLIAAARPNSMSSCTVARAYPELQFRVRIFRNAPYIFMIFLKFWKMWTKIVDIGYAIYCEPWIFCVKI
jgi:hypothetical protein